MYTFYANNILLSRDRQCTCLHRLYLIQHDFISPYNGASLSFGARADEIRCFTLHYTRWKHAEIHFLFRILTAMLVILGPITTSSTARYVCILNTYCVDFLSENFRNKSVTSLNVYEKYSSLKQLFFVMFVVKDWMLSYRLEDIYMQFLSYLPFSRKNYTFHFYFAAVKSKVHCRVNRGIKSKCAIYRLNYKTLSR